MNDFVKAYLEKDKNTDNVIYEDKRGHLYRKSEGSKAWRNNNPGNLICGNFSERHGSIGNAGRFAIFPNYEQGKFALESLLKTDSYQNLTIGEAINRYAPSVENNTSLYQKFVEKETGLLLNILMKNLSYENFQNIINAIIKYEGTKEGIFEVLPFDSKFIWRTKKDDRVRDSHRLKEGKIFYWYKAEILPGSEFGCRCYAEKYID